MDEAPGPHGPVPVRIYAPGSADDAPCLVWMHGGGFVGGHLDMLHGFLNLPGNIEPVSDALDLIGGTVGAARSAMRR